MARILPPLPSRFDFNAGSVLVLLLLLVLFSSNNHVFACLHNGIRYSNGDEWLEKNAFVMRCTIQPSGSWRSEVVACALPNARRVPINTALEDGNFLWRCKMDENGKVELMQGMNPNARCDEHPVGSIWREKSFEIQCLPGGYKRLISCITEQGYRVSVNGSLEVNGFIVECKQFENGTVIFKSVDASVPINSPPQYAQPIIRSPYARNNYNNNKNNNNDENEDVLCHDDKGMKHRVGDFWLENFRFNKTCKADGDVAVVSCVSRNGLQVPMDHEIVEGSAKYSCTKTKEGTIRFSAGPVVN